MKNIINQTIRVAVVSLFAFFMLAGDAFAAPILAPVAVTNITGESATLEGYVTNQGRNSIVWFEWSEGASTAAPNIVARQGLYNEGAFTWTLRDLTPGVVYSYRSAAMDGGVITYTPTGSFRTPVKNNSASAQIVYQGGQAGGALGIAPYNQTTAPSSEATQVPIQASTQAPVQTQVNTNTNTTAVVERKNIVATTTVIKTDGFTNGNSASVGSVGDGVLPSTLIGWVLLLISILIMVLVMVMIYEASEKRRAEKEEMKKRKEKENDDEVVE